MGEFQQLHRRMSNWYLQPSSVLDSNEISARFNNVLPMNIATLVSNTFLQDLRSRNVRISGLRATIVYPIATDENPWTIVEWIEWIEDNKTELMSIYQIAEDSGICGYLMHLGVVSPISKSMDISRWEHCCIVWKVADITQLKALFGGVRHIMELLSWSLNDILKLYCESQVQDCSEEK